LEILLLNKITVLRNRNYLFRFPVPVPTFDKFRFRLRFWLLFRNRNELPVPLRSIIKLPIFSIPLRQKVKVPTVMVPQHWFVAAGIWECNRQKGMQLSAAFLPTRICSQWRDENSVSVCNIVLKFPNQSGGFI